jgi:hypothetical protein
VLDNPRVGGRTTTSGITIHAGGEAQAKAKDNSVITLTGSGTFEPGEPDEVTGGGAWKIADSSGHVLGMGRYLVTQLIRFDPAPGTLPATFADTIGGNEDARAGLVYLAIRYSDGRDGILVVSCELPAGTPPAVLEGVTASKQFVDFFNFTSGDTVLHVIRQGEDQ